MSDAQKDDGAVVAAAAETAEEQSSVQWDNLSAGVPGEDDSGDDGAASAASSADEGEELGTAASSEGEPEGAASTEEPAAATASVAATTEEPPATATAPVTQSPAVEAPEAVKPPTPEELAAREAEYQKWLDGEREKLTTEVYALSQEDAERLQTEPELVLPKLLANMHLNLQRTMLEGMQNILPGVLSRTTQIQQKEEEAKSLFYGAHPDLKAHHRTVVEVGKTYRQLNPKATPDEAIEGIALMARQILKIKAPEAGAAAAKGKPTAPAAPHRPQRPGSTGAKPAAAPEKNIFSDLIDD